MNDILIKQRNEVFSVILSEFDKELYETDLKEEAYEEGVSQGEYNKLFELVVRQLKQGKTEKQIAETFGEPIELIRKIADEWGIRMHES